MIWEIKDYFRLLRELLAVFKRYFFVNYSDKYNENI
jgi:hypothetical protein